MQPYFPCASPQSPKHSTYGDDGDTVSVLVIRQSALTVPLLYILHFPRRRDLGIIPSVNGCDWIGSKSGQERKVRLNRCVRLKRESLNIILMPFQIPYG